MDNKNVIAQQEITVRLVVNGYNVKMNFAQVSNGKVLKKVKTNWHLQSVSPLFKTAM